MGRPVRFRCPHHPDIILFEGESSAARDEPRTLKSVVPERPELCAHCQKYYYRWECPPVPVQGGEA